MTDINTKYSYWENKLLNLEKRNRLLNYDDGRSVRVKIVAPDDRSLWEMLVINEESLVFPFREDEAEDFFEKKHKNTKTNIDTDKKISELQNALRKLRSKAKTIIEERGINILYLSFGFLNWTENDDSSQIFKSPLVLVPVSLSVESINSPYVLNLHDDEITLNKTLAYKLQRDFGIDLPVFDEDSAVDKYIDLVSEVIQKKNWSVSKDVSLSCLSFAKISMYLDLTQHRDAIISSPIVRAIGGDNTALKKISEDLLGIESAIKVCREKNQEFEQFFVEDKEEAFFVKSLENVQGDERDTIILSIGYARDKAGRFTMNFGPLNKSGGERRLNVAITRAKFNVKLVGSIKPTDIDIDKIRSEGPKLLRMYIEFAMKGPSVLENEVKENEVVNCESPFEEAVYNFLERKGYSLVTQVGCSGYRIDMAVKHPQYSGVYVLAIECDGATYHSSRTARERDRLRQEVLENMGWKFYRVWSTDWMRDSVSEGEKLIDAINDAIRNYDRDDSPQELESSSSKEVYEDEEEEHIIELVDTDEENSDNSSLGNPYGFEKNIESDFADRGVEEITDCLMEAINVEYPIHYELLCQRMAPLFGNKKATVKVRKKVDSALAILKNKIQRNEDFIYPANCQTVSARYPNNRDVEHIATEELADAAYRILQKHLGTTHEDLCSKTAKAYSFRRMGSHIATAISKAINSLLQTGKIEELDGKLRLKQ